MKRPLSLFVVLACIFAAGAIVVGCGGSDDKPAYCDSRDELTSSINDLKDINVTSLPTDLPDQVQTIKTNATDFANATQDAFPQESQELETQVNDLSDSVSNVADGGSINAQSAIKIVGQISSTVSAAEALQNKVDEGCN